MSFKQQIDYNSLAKYFLFGFVPAPATIFKHKTKPISDLLRLDYSQKITDWSEKEIKQEVINQIRKAVKTYLPNEFPVGIFLSGGVDSGLTAAIIREFLLPSQIYAFSIAFKEKEVDESHYAKITAQHLGLKHHFIKVFSGEQAIKLMPQIGEILQEPMADPSLLVTLFLFSFAKTKVKTAFLGDGGDENFAGYPKYLAHSFLSKTHFDKLPLSFLARFLSGRAGAFFRYADYPLYLRNQFWINPFSTKEVKELTGIKVKLDDLEKCHQLFNGKEPLDEAFFLDQNLTLHDLYLVKTKQASKATGLNICCPLLSKELFEFCAKIPFNLKLKNWQTKSLLKEIALDFLPKQVVCGPKKGFGIPLDKWLKNDLKDLVLKELSPQKIKQQGILNSEAVKQILKKENPNQIWTLLVFQLWLKKWLKN